jgi:hypothetical protein
MDDALQITIKESDCVIVILLGHLLATTSQNWPPKNKRKLKTKKKERKKKKKKRKANTICKNQIG